MCFAFCISTVEIRREIAIQEARWGLTEVDVRQHGGRLQLWRGVKGAKEEK